MIGFFFLQSNLALNLEKVGLLRLPFLELPVDLVFLVEELYVEVVGLAILSNGHFYLLDHQAINDNCCCLPRTLPIHSHSLNGPQLLPEELQLVLRRQLSMLIAEFTD